jgi:hypothetical protein
MLPSKFVALSICILLLPAAVAAKKPTGKISDPAAFSKIQSYCIDTSDLSGDEALDLKNFVSAENKPKKLLSKLPWTLVSDCSQGPPDVVVRMELQKFAPIGNNAPAEGELFTFRAVLRLSQGSFSQVLYEVEAAPSNNSMGAMSDAPLNDPPAVQRYDAIYAAFWMLIEDVQRVSQSSPKR